MDKPLTATYVAFPSTPWNWFQHPRGVLAHQVKKPWLRDMFVFHYHRLPQGKTLGKLQPWCEYSSIYIVHNFWPISKPYCFDQVRLNTEVA